MRKTAITLICCTALLLIGYTGYRGYKVWKRDHMMSLARQFAAKSDSRNALLCLQQVLRSDPRHLEGARMMAQLLEAGRSPAALVWRNRVVELNPRSLDDRVALAQTALIFGDRSCATNALEGVDEVGRTTAAYHNVAGAVATSEGQLAEAETHFMEASRLEPTNPLPQLNLAAVRLHGTNTLDIEEARIALRRITTNPNSGLRCQALRELVADAMHYKRADEALTLTRQLLQETNSGFSDRLLLLAELQKNDNPEFKSTLADFQREAADASAKLYELTLWQMVNRSPADALNWLRSLPQKTQTNQPVAFLTSQCLLMQQDWRGLQAWLQPQNWAELEFVRHAFEARAMRGQDLVVGAKSEWDKAVAAAGGHKGTLVMLLRLAAQWNWQTEAEDLLWTIVDRYPGENWAMQALTQALFVGGRTRSLMTLCQKQLKLTPKDLKVKNNLAMIALLLDANELKPHDLAREVYEREPTNAAFASTYAFSLHVQKKDAEALKVLERLKPQELQQPSTAGYYGLILQATGNKPKAKPFLEWSSRAPVLLPEEKRLFDEAKARI